MFLTACILDESTLKAGIKSGNELAYQHLFNRYYGFLISCASKYLDSSSECRDVVQEVFIKIFKKRETLDIKNIKPYLARSVYHACLEQVRAKKDHEETKEHHLVYHEDHMVQAEREAEIWQAIDDLPEKCRQIFVMNRFDAMTNQQIAEKLNISKRTVETQISLALRKLRDKLLSLPIFFSW